MTRKLSLFWLGIFVAGCARQASLQQREETPAVQKSGSEDVPDDSGKLQLADDSPLRSDDDVLAGKPLTDWVSALRNDDLAVRRSAAAALREVQFTADVALVLVESLKDEDYYVRTDAAEALAGIGTYTEEVISAITELLADTNTAPRDRAAELLGRVGSQAKSAVPALIELLKDRDGSPWERSAALRALGKIGPDAKNAVPIIIELINASGPDVRREDVASALGGIGPDAIAGVPWLANTLKDKDLGVRQAAAWALGRIGSLAKEAVPALIAALDDEAQTGSVSVVLALGKVGTEATAAIPALNEVLRDKNDSERRAAAAEALGKISPQGSVPMLIESLQDESAYVRATAAETLGVIGPLANSAVPALTEAIVDRDHEVRRAAIRALVSIGPNPQTAIQPLVWALIDTDGIIRQRAANALVQIGPDTVPLLIAALAKGGVPVHDGVPDVLARIGDPAIPSLIRLLGHPEYSVRSRASVALVKMGTPSVRPLMDALANEQPVARAWAARTIGQLGPTAEQAAPALVMALTDGENIVRAETAISLGKLSASATVETTNALRQALGDTDQFVSASAAYALLEITHQPNGAVPALVKALKRRDNPTSWFAAEVISRVAPACKDTVPALVGVLNDPGEETSGSFVPMDLADHFLQEHRNWIHPSDVRYAALDALAKIGPEAKEAAPVLVALMEADDASAAVALGHVDFNALVQALGHNNSRTRQMAAGAMIQLGPNAKNAVSSLINALNDTEQSVRVAAADALGSIGPDAGMAVPELVRLLQEEILKHERLLALKALAGNPPYSELWLAVSEALGNIGPRAERAVPTLVEFLAYKDEIVRWRAAMSLVAIGKETDSAVPVLLDTLGRWDFDDEYRWCATAEAMASVGPKSKASAPKLVEALCHGNAHVRSTAARALGVVGVRSNDVIQHLVHAMEDEDDLVRENATQSLLKIAPQVFVHPTEHLERRTN